MIENQKTKSKPTDHLQFERKNETAFYKTVRKRVNQYFKENNINKKANGFMYFKTIFILSMCVGTYLLVLLGEFDPLVLLGIACVHGFFTALIGLNISHDAIHGAYSSKTWVNKLVGLTFNLVGANDYVWSISHNVVHHTYTNIPDHDGDIDQVPIIRMNPNQALWGIHKFQHIYIFFLYSLASISWVLSKDYVNFFKKKIGTYDTSNKPVKEYFRLFFYKAVYYTFLLVIPMLVLDLPWYQILLGFFCLHVVEGLTLSLIFQLGHIVEGTAFPKPKGINMPYSWAEHQLYTSANYGCGSSLVNFIAGGLNFQIEHHLFTNICHVHYPKIAPIVRETAHEFGLPYIEYKTYGNAVSSHLRALKFFGRHEKVDKILVEG